MMTKEQIESWGGEEMKKALKIAAEATMTSAMMPNQFHGMLDGRPFYFRARHGRYELRLGPEGGDFDSAVNGEIVDEAEVKDAGWWEEAHAREHLAESISIYLEALNDVGGASR